MTDVLCITWVLGTVFCWSVLATGVVWASFKTPSKLNKGTLSYMLVFPILWPVVVGVVLLGVILCLFMYVFEKVAKAQRRATYVGEPDEF